MVAKDRLSITGCKCTASCYVITGILKVLMVGTNRLSTTSPLLVVMDMLSMKSSLMVVMDTLSITNLLMVPIIDIISNNVIDVF